MFNVSIPQISNKALFETELQPPQSAIDKLLKGRKNEGVINIIFNKKNKVAVGVPYYENLVSRLSKEKQKIPHEIKLMLAKYDFHFIALSCSFLPDNKCKFTWARFGVELNAITKTTNEFIKERPIAYDMFPDEITSTISYKKVMNISPKLKLGNK